jgi:cytochrome c peroxidase
MPLTMKIAIRTVTLVFLFIVSLSFMKPDRSDIGVGTMRDYFKRGAKEFTESAFQLRKAVNGMDSSRASILDARQKLAECRIKYKRIEFLVEYFFENRVKIFNLAPVYEIEEPFMEWQSPIGLQVIEANLFDDNPFSLKDELKLQAEVVHSTSESLYQIFAVKTDITDEQIMESMRLELVRIAALSITGYDAPEMRSGIRESLEALEGMEYCIQPFLSRKSPNADSVRLYLSKCKQLLARNPDFVSFDRLGFLTDAMLPLQQELGEMITKMELELNTTPALNYSTPNLFSRKTLNMHAFSGDTGLANPYLADLGRELFFEKRLSGNGRRNCATCHSPEKYFTDSLEKSLAFDEVGHVKRNAPSLLYAAYQHGQFLDSRTKTLEEQIHTVLASPVEMNMKLGAIPGALKEDKHYRQMFKKAFPNAKKDSIFAVGNVASALAAFERSLPVMTSAFDRYLSGDKEALSVSQIKGFNLFMGKAQCGSCHFAPLFNGLLPPLYDITELESLGMTANTDFMHPVADADSGKFGSYPIEFYIGVFKTPTVRNAAKTPPYMHNGAFATLEQVVEFYNQGGGNGMGLNNPYQTLSSKKLNLSKEEVGQLVDFLKALTDEPVVVKRRIQ